MGGKPRNKRWTHEVVLANHLQVPSQLPIHFAPGFSLRNAGTKPKRDFGAMIDRCCSLNLRPYEHQRIRSEGIAGWARIPESSWKYYTIRFQRGDSNNLPLHELLWASNLTSVELEPGWFSSKGSFDVRGHTGVRFYEYINWLATSGETETIDAAYLSRLSKVWQRLHELGDQHRDVYRAVRMFDELKSVPSTARVLPVALFAIIECLLTRNPKQGQGKINYQVETKLDLVSKRFPTALEYGPLGKMNERKQREIWQKLYEFRSCVAHGGIPNFSQSTSTSSSERGKSLQVLKNYGTAVWFLRQVTKRVLEHALHDPALYLDLRRC